MPKPSRVGKDLFVEIGPGPCCPACQNDCFDDWWHAKTIKHGMAGVSIQGSLRCHNCSKFFSVTLYTETMEPNKYERCHSQMWRKRKAA